MARPKLLNEEIYATTRVSSAARSAICIRTCSGLASEGIGGPALHSRVLLQSEVGFPGGVPALIQEEPLSHLEAAGGNGAHRARGDARTREPHDRRCALGLPRDDRVQERRRASQQLRRSSTC